MTKKSNTPKPQFMDLYSVLAVLHNDVEHTLDALKQPMNQNKVFQESLRKNLSEILNRWYKIVKDSINNGTITADPSGILINNTVFTRLKKSTDSFPHHHLVKAIVQKIIDEDQAMTNQKPNLVTDVVPSFHTPYIASIESQLEKMNALTEEQEIKDSKSVLKKLTRNWVDAFYKSVLDTDNPDSVKTDEGILKNSTIFSTAEYTKYDHADLVDQFITEFNKTKAKPIGTKNKTSMFAMASMIVNGHDDSVKEFGIVNDATGETVVVNKEDNTVHVLDSEGKVSLPKRAWAGFKHFLNSVKQMFIDFWNWIKGFFVKDQGERVIVSPEEAARMEEEAKLEANKLTAA